MSTVDVAVHDLLQDYAATQERISEAIRKLNETVGSDEEAFNTALDTEYHPEVRRSLELEEQVRLQSQELTDPVVIAEVRAHVEAQIARFDAGILNVRASDDEQRVSIERRLRQCRQKAQAWLDSL